VKCAGLTTLNNCTTALSHCLCKTDDNVLAQHSTLWFPFVRDCVHGNDNIYFSGDTAQRIFQTCGALRVQLRRNGSSHGGNNGASLSVHVVYEE